MCIRGGNVIDGVACSSNDESNVLFTLDDIELPPEQLFKEAVDYKFTIDELKKLASKDLLKINMVPANALLALEKKIRKDARIKSCQIEDKLNKYILNVRTMKKIEKYFERSYQKHIIDEKRNAFILRKVHSMHKLGIHNFLLEYQENGNLENEPSQHSVQCKKNNIQKDKSIVIINNNDIQESEPLGTFTDFEPLFISTQSV